MTSTSSDNLFEKLAPLPFASDGIRPGGIELTRRGLRLARIGPGNYALDVGCGKGVTVEFLIRDLSIHAVGIDSSPALVAQAKAKDSTLPLLLGEAEVLPFHRCSFDLVLMECTLSLVRDSEEVLNECRRVLKPAGRLIVTDLYARNPQGISGLRHLPLQSCLKGALLQDRFISECESAGFLHANFEDHSQMLTEFTAKIIWNYGSLDRFWAETTAGSADPARIGQAIKDARPGYFLYVGRKSEGLTAS